MRLTAWSRRRAPSPPAAQRRRHLHVPEQRQDHRAVDKVSPPQPKRRTGEAEQPFQAQPPDRERRTPLRAGEELLDLVEDGVAIAQPGRVDPLRKLDQCRAGNVLGQIAGVPEQDHVRVVRGDPSQGKFSVLYFEGDVLTSVESINAAADHIAARKLITARTPIPMERAADPAIPLKDVAASTAA